MSVVDRVHTMRKTVIDELSTSGFQRTAVAMSMDASQGRGHWHPLPEERLPDIDDRAMSLYSH